MGHKFLTSCFVYFPGSIHKLNNHQTEFGVTDAIKIFENLLLCSGYDLDNGVGYINGKFHPWSPSPNEVLFTEEGFRLLQLGRGKQVLVSPSLASKNFPSEKVFDIIILLSKVFF